MKLRFPQIDNEEKENILNIKLHHCSNDSAMLSYNDVYVLLIDKDGTASKISLREEHATALKECGVALNKNEFGSYSIMY